MSYERALCTFYVKEANSVGVRATVAAATLQHAAKLNFCQNRDSTLAGMVAESMDMIVECYLIVLMTYGARAPRVSSDSGVKVKASVGASAKSAIL